MPDPHRVVEAHDGLIANLISATSLTRTNWSTVHDLLDATVAVAKNEMDLLTMDVLPRDLTSKYSDICPQ